MFLPGKHRLVSAVAETKTVTGRIETAFFTIFAT